MFGLLTYVGDNHQGCATITVHAAVSKTATRCGITLTEHSFEHSYMYHYWSFTTGYTDRLVGEVLKQQNYVSCKRCRKYLGLDKP